MKGKSKDSRPHWVDPDDAPELDDAFFERGQWKMGEREVSREAGQAAARKALGRGRPKAAHTKRALTVRYDEDVIEAFRATGPGWQTRMNDALRDWLESHPTGTGR
jgi:uncharacterized protein (DUF4415 family)